MTRSRPPSPHDVDRARRDPRLLRAARADNVSEWRAEALCREVDPEVFFPTTTGSAEDDAVAWCKQCDVQPECLAFALNAGDCEGVYGGTTPKERRAMLVAWRQRVGVRR